MDPLRRTLAPRSTTPDTPRRPGSPAHTTRVRSSPGTDHRSRSSRSAPRCLTAEQQPAAARPSGDRTGDGSPSHALYHDERMADTLTSRPDEDAVRALAVPTQDGRPVPAAVRGALIRAARAVAAERLRAGAAELAADESDHAEAAQVLRDGETLRAWCVVPAPSAS